MTKSFEERKLENEQMKYRIVECVFKDHDIQIENGIVLDGPIEGALIVTMPHHQLAALCQTDNQGTFVKNIEETLKGAGWDGEVIVISEEMKFARFEPV